MRVLVKSYFEAIKNASCSENLRLDCLHFIEMMDFIFNCSINMSFNWLQVFWQKYSILVWSALHTTFKAEIPSLESFLTQDAMGNEGPAVHSSPLMLWWTLSRDRLSFLVDSCHSTVAMASDKYLHRAFENSWILDTRFPFSVSQSSQPQMGSYHSPFCKAIKRETQKQGPPWPFEVLSSFWRTVNTPEGLTTRWFLTAKRSPRIFLAWEEATSQPRQRAGALSQHCLVPGYKSFCLETLASL